MSEPSTAHVPPCTDGHGSSCSSALREDCAPGPLGSERSGRCSRSLLHHFGPPKTRAGRRRVPLPRFVADELATHVAGLEPNALVFPAPRGGPVQASLFRRRVWQPAVEAAGLAPLRLHDLRHTAVAMWIAAGASPNEVAARAGHTSTVTVLDRYGHLLPGGEERVTDALDAMARTAHRDTGDAEVQPLRR
jgi:integrase